jgi:heptosyltransferase-2
MKFWPTIWTSLRIQAEAFDLAICLDKALPAAALASLAKAKKKVGFGLSKEGRVYPLNKEAEYEFSLGLSDELKFRKNKKTYQQIIFQTAGLKFRGQEYVLELSLNQSRFCEEFLKKNGLGKGDFKVGLNTGCGSVFPFKKWTTDGFAELADRLVEELGAKVLLLGGPHEAERNNWILKKINAPVIDAGCKNSLQDFISIVNCCDLIVTGDTLAMHIAIALRKRVVALFGPTCAQEVELYNRGIKIVADLDCAPCYRSTCERDKKCMEAISVEQVFNAVSKLRDRG